MEHVCHVAKTCHKQIKINKTSSIFGPYGFSMKLFPAGSSKMKVKGVSALAQALSLDKNWSMASAVLGSTFCVQQKI